MGIGTGTISNWGSFGSSGGLADCAGAPKVSCDAGGSVAVAAINAAGLTVSSNATVGGDLGDLDIKRMDVKTAISMSLMHEFASTNTLYDVVANYSGGLDIIQVGAGGTGPDDIYYYTQTTSFFNPITHVMVTGKNPLPEIRFGGWYDVLNGAKVYDQLTMFNNCRKEGFKNYATIVYDDPQLSTSYSDGIDNLYNVSNPWEKVIGYVHFKGPPAYLATNPDVKVSWSNEATIPIQVGVSADMGTVAELTKVNYEAGGGAGCFAGQGTTATGGVPIKNIPRRYTTNNGVTVDRFLRVSAVYLIGMRIDNLFYGPNSSAVSIATPGVGNSTLWVSINKMGFNVFKCEEGRHYAISITDGEPAIVFAKETRAGDPFIYGKSVSFKVDPFCNFALTAGKSSGEGIIFPTSKSEGIWVQEIWAAVDVETPSITIFDPKGNAKTLADAFVYKICPISVIDEPAPIAVNGTLVGQDDGVKDGDITTAQSIADTDLETALDGMQGSGMTVSWSFLDKTGVQNASNYLQSLMSSSSLETIYTCGPGCHPTLGASSAGGGSINAIRYSYTDQGSYTVSVTAGPKFAASALVSVDGGPTPKMTEDISARGVVVGSNGDNVNFKVRIDGYGDRWAMSMTPHIIRVGDAVQCSIHNNPVES